MFVDASVFVAILAEEEDAPRLSASIEHRKDCCTSSLALLETTVVLATRLDKRPTDVEKLLDEAINAMGIAVVPITAEMTRIAVRAFEQYGKGRGHPAQLKLADCMAYAVAKVRKVPLLYKGNDFAFTDLA